MPRQFVDQPLVEQELKELGLCHVGGQFQVIEAAFAKFVDDIGLVVFEDDQIHSLTSGRDAKWWANPLSETAALLTS